MTKAHITDIEDNSKLALSADRFAQDTIKNSFDNGKKMTKAATAAIAALVKMLSRLAMEGVSGIFDRFKNRGRQKDSGLGNITDVLSRENRSKSITQRLGNKARGLVRGSKAKTAGKMAQAGSRFSKTAKVANMGKNAKVANNLVKAGRLAKTAKTASTVMKAGKAAKTANTAYKVAKAAKLANVARIGLQGGLTLAGGPVGIALLAGSIVAPYAIEAIWKNKEKIYAGGKNLVSKSKLSVQEVTGLLDGKQAKVGEIVPRARDLKVVGDNSQTLLETDEKGKVLTNNFDPNHKLAFYQEKEGEKTMLLDEADLSIPNAEPTANQGDLSRAISDSTQSGTAVIQGSLAQLKQNNPDNPEVRQQADLLSGSLNAAETKPQISGVRNSISLNEAGSSIINLFNSQVPPDRQGQKLETEEFSINRRGNDYFLKDKEGNTLLQAANTGFGSKVLSSNLNPSQMQDLAYLKQDLRLDRGITGSFTSMAEPAAPNLSAKTAQDAPNPAKGQTMQAEASSVELPTAQQSPANVPSSLPSEGAKETKLPTPPPSSAFSQYLPQEDKVPAMAGHSKEKSSDMER